MRGESAGKIVRLFYYYIVVGVVAVACRHLCIVISCCLRQQQSCLRHSFASHVCNAASPARLAKDSLHYKSHSFGIRPSHSMHAGEKERVKVTAKVVDIVSDLAQAYAGKFCRPLF